MDDNGIDPDRILNGDLVPDEYLCPICRHLLWKPRSCASCQHLFCEGCLRTWFESPNSAQKCPFRCSPFEERRCPPYVQSILSKLSIHCRNAAFGCPAIVPYDALEQHETVHCPYMTERCRECDQRVLVSTLAEHQQSASLCVPQPIKCTICQQYVPKPIFREHFHQCCQQQVNHFIQQTNRQRTLQLLVDGQAAPPNPVTTLLQSTLNTIQLFEQQKQLSRLPSSLKGIDAVRRAEEQGRNCFYHILVMLKFMCINWSKAPFFLYIMILGNCLLLMGLLLGASVFLSQWTYTHITYGPVVLMILNYLLSFGTNLVLQHITDTKLIIGFIFVMFLLGSAGKAPLELLENDRLFNRPVVCIIFCCVGLVLMKLALLLIRLYYWLIPVYVSAIIITLLACGVGYALHRMDTKVNPPLPSPPTTNRLTMPV